MAVASGLPSPCPPSAAVPGPAYTRTQASQLMIFFLIRTYPTRETRRIPSAVQEHQVLERGPKPFSGHSSYRRDGP